MIVKRAGTRDVRQYPQTQGRDEYARWHMLISSQKLLDCHVDRTRMRGLTRRSRNCDCVFSGLRASCHAAARLQRNQTQQDCKRNDPQKHTPITGTRRIPSPEEDRSSDRKPKRYAGTESPRLSMAREPVLTVSVALAFPLASKITESAFKEQVGAPACAG
jgi:hypothetical protein